MIEVFVLPAIGAAVGYLIGVAIILAVAKHCERFPS